MYEWMDGEKKDELMDGWTYEWMDGEKKDGLMDGWTDERVQTSEV